jgi:hypothetical protein
MKTPTKTSFLIASGIAFAIALAVWTPLRAQSADPVDSVPMTSAQMVQHCKEMKAERQAFNDDVKAQDAQLTEQLSNLNSAPQDKKVDQMSVVLTLLVGQRVDMDVRRAKMQDDTMRHMMQHMEIGKGSLTQCPMCKGSDDSPPVSPR